MTMSGTQSAITFAATNGTLHAYGVSYNSTEVTQCAVNDNGSFFNCVPTGQTLTNPTGLAFSTSGSTQYAYITQHGSTTVTQCTIKTDGSFDTCTTAGTLSSNLTGISFGVVSGTQYAFVSTNSGAVYHCSLNNDGSFNTCVSTQVATAIKSNVVAGYALGYSQYSYVVDGSNVDLCSLNSVNGSFGTCNATGSGWTTPQTTATTTVYSASGIPRQYAYITDTTAPGVYYCPVNENGTLSACGITATGVTWTSPFGIVFQTINGTQYAYITDMGDSSGTPAVQGSVQQCTVENTGVLDNCNSLSPTFSSGGPLEYPQALTIQTFNQTYAYITDNGSIYQCTFINANDATNGNLTNCIQTGGSAINNTSIAFATMPDDNTPYLYLTNPSVSGTTPAFMLVDTDIDSTTGLPLGSSFFQGMGPWTGDIATWGIAMGVTIATFDQQYAYIADSGNAAVFQCTFQTGNHGLINIPCAPTSVGTFTTPTNILFSQALITSQIYLCQKKILLSFAATG